MALTLYGAGQSVVNTTVFRGSSSAAQNFGSTTGVDTLMDGWSHTVVKKNPNNKLICYIRFASYVDGNVNHYWHVRANVNGSFISNQNSGNISGCIATHNPQQFGWRGTAHQHFTTQYVEETVSDTLNFKYYMYLGGTGSGGSFIIWNVYLPEFIYMEVSTQ